MCKITCDTFLDSLGITERDKDHVPSLKVQADVQAANDLNLGVSDVRFIDALFINEETAIELLAGNRERLISSMRHAVRFLRSFDREDIRVLDFGGGLGLVSFWCAFKFPKMSFLMEERSDNCLIIGKRWCKKLALPNVIMSKEGFSANAGRYDAIIAEYVFSMQPSDADSLRELRELTALSLSQFKPAMQVGGRCQVRFGGFNKIGLAVLIEEVRRNEFSFHLLNTWSGKKGTTVTLSLGGMANHRGRLPTTKELFQMLSQHKPSYTDE